MEDIESMKKAVQMLDENSWEDSCKVKIGTSIWDKNVCELYEQRVREHCSSYRKHARA